MKNLCVVTSSRADYGLIKLLLKKINSSKYLKLNLIVTGTHLSSEYGYTYKEILSDGFKIKDKINLPIINDSAKNITECLAKSIQKFGKFFNLNNFDSVLILGDRYEILGVACAALINRIPIIHLHGGEKTIGAYDDSFRHSISKMSNLHFVANTEYKKRLIQLGESPSKIHIVGGLGVDAIRNLKLIKINQLKNKLKINFNKKNLLIVFHPVTLQKNMAAKQIKELLNSVQELQNTNLFFTMSNSDSENDIINKSIRNFVKKNKNSYFFKSLGQENFISLLSYVDAIVGNSSSGIIEAPVVKTITLNIGNRQKGRLMSKSILNCNPDKKEIIKNIKKIFSGKFKSNFNNPYGNGGANKKIISILENKKINISIQKNFYDLPIKILKQIR